MSPRADFARRSFLQASGVALAGLGAVDASGEGQAAAGPNDQPSNIIVYMTDEHRCDCIGAYGNSVIRTPNIDRLAASGIRLNSMFSQFPLCGPSRSCFTTGQYPQAHGVHFNGVPLRPHTPRLPRALRASGYTTAHVGMFNIEPRQGDVHGYDIFRHQENEYAKWAAERGVTDTYPYGGEPRPNGYYGRVDYPAEVHAANWVAETSIEVLEQISRRPFYLEINERYPHLPYVAPAPYDTMYSPDEVPIAPSVSRDRDDFRAIQEMHAVYYGMISLVDDAFGRVLDAVERLGLLDNTVIVFTTDHGDMIGHHDLWSKWALYDDDARLPFIIRYPGQVAQGTAIDGLAEQIDMAPTLLGLAGAPVPRGMQGASLLPLLEGRSDGKDAVFGYQSYEEYPAKIRARRQMVRTRDWKLIHMPEGESLLFDLRNDPYEMVNRYGDPACAAVVQELKDRLLLWHLDAVDTTVPSLFIPGETEEAQEWIRRYIDPVV